VPQETGSHGARLSWQRFLLQGGVSTVRLAKAVAERAATRSSESANNDEIPRWGARTVGVNDFGAVETTAAKER
jgi:hypothetical protein